MSVVSTAMDVSAVTADTLVLTGAGRFYGGRLSSSGANAVDVVVYDNTSAAGKVVGRGHSDAGESVEFGPPSNTNIPLQIGLYVDVTGTSPQVEIYYTQG